MAESVVLNNYSDDSQIKSFINNNLMPRVFKNIPLNVLNMGEFSIINEYLSQGIENLAFTSSFYFNESFITKAVLPDSIFAEAAIFNLGYAFATPSSCNMLLELHLDSVYKNATLNPETGLYEFILDKDTIINLMDNGNEYSLDYDILIQYRNIKTSESVASIPAWNCQYINMDENNMIATNKDRYITYRVTSKWLCLFIQVNEYTRTKYTITNNTTNGIAMTDKLITCTNHICGFDIKYVDTTNGTSQWIPHDHILPIHANVKDNEPYVHYVMDNPQTIRFMFQLDGNRRFIPTINSTYEIYVYTCHGEAANFNEWDNEQSQPKVISKANKYPNNANVLKACFVLAGGSVGGTNIGTVETVRRETIEAYNTVNVLSTDHDLDEWLKTFYFKNILYPYFFKRRDDPWGRIWSGYLALKDDDDYVYRTNTLHANISYDVLYSNNDNTVTNNEIIIPPGWTWIYEDYNERMTLRPITKTASKKVETVKSLSSYPDKFVFANPFGIRIQKQPFAIGYFNPWVNQYLTTTNTGFTNTNPTDEYDQVVLYHATAVYTEIRRLYKDDYYKLTTYVLPSIDYWGDNRDMLVPYVRRNSAEPVFVTQTWNYFQHPLDLFASTIPMIPLSEDEDGYLPFNKEYTFFCVKSKDRIDDNTWRLQNIWIDDYTSTDMKRIHLPINGDITRLVGSNAIWGVDGVCKDYSVYSTGVTDINIYPSTITEKDIEFGRVQNQNYYRMGLTENAVRGRIKKIVVKYATLTSETGYDESVLYRIGNKYDNVILNIYFNDGTQDEVTVSNAAVIYTPYICTQDDDGMYEIDMQNVDGGNVIIYAEMKPSADSGSIDYYRVPFSAIEDHVSIFGIENKLLPMDKNNMRVVLSAFINGTETGYVEMQPVSHEDDDTYRFETQMYPLNELVDIDDRIRVASTDVGGGAWTSLSKGSAVTVSASNPTFKISILIRTETPNYETEIHGDTRFDGFRVVDEYSIDPFELIQELKEMRSIVNFGDSSIPTQEQMQNYNDFISLYNPNSSDNDIYTLYKYAYSRVNNMRDTYPLPYDQVIATAKDMYGWYTQFEREYTEIILAIIPDQMVEIDSVIKSITESEDPVGSDVDWNLVSNVLQEYISRITNSFSSVNVNGGVNIQLVPFVESKLMINDRFSNFVQSFVNVHKAIEPIIFNRLDGNHYLDCKLIATYGLPHTYCTDDEKLKNLPKEQTQFWPNLSVQISFDVRFKNPSLITNTTDELKNIVKSYFNKLTTLHSPTDRVSMNNNIYISRLIHEMGDHDNVEYMKFNGFYTMDKNKPKGDYMDANVQAIVQRWDTLEDFPKYSSDGRMISELENFVPEMFILEDDNIIINSI